MITKSPPTVLNNLTLFLYILAVLQHPPWQNAKSPLEVVIQMALIGKPHLVRDFGNSQPPVAQ